MIDVTKIVIIEDNNLISLLIKQMISLYDNTIDVIILENGISALNHFLDLIGNNKPLPNLVFMDVNIPGINGFELLDYLNEMKLPLLEDNLPFIIMSGSLDNKNIQQLETYSYVKGFLKKPFEQNTLLNFLEQYLINRNSNF